jgi:outer membrane protein TolC
LPKRTCVLIAAAVLAGCVKYHPRPIDAPAAEQRYRARTLSDPGLKAFAKADRWPPAALDAAAAVVSALYFHPEIEVARARVRSAEAGVVSAGARVNPAVGFGGGVTNSPESHAIRSFEPSFTIETAGKRGLRIIEAQRNAVAARLALAEAEWGVRSRARNAWQEAVFARRTVEALRRERQARADYAAVFEKRLAAGEAARPEVDLARSELLNADVALRAAETQAAESVPNMAAAMGVPVAAIRDYALAEPPSPPEETSVPIGRIQTAGLLNRADVRRSLAEYAAAEAGLKLEVAKQYPDVQLLPGYGFDEGHYRYTFGPAFAAPVFHRNQGPIAEAGARRAEAEARFLAVQARAIAEMESALARYRAARAEWRDAEDRLVTLERGREAAARRALEAGEEDRLSLDAVRIRSAQAARAAEDALRRTHAALAALEDAVQQPLRQP